MQKDNDNESRKRRKETQKAKKVDNKTFGQMEKVEKRKENMKYSIKKTAERQYQCRKE